MFIRPIRTKNIYTEKKYITINYNKITIVMLSQCQIIEHNVHKICPKQNFSSLLYWYYKIHYI